MTENYRVDDGDMDDHNERRLGAERNVGWLRKYPKKFFFIRSIL